MKNITLVNVSTDVALTQPNLGLCYLASYLRDKGFEVQYVDEVSGEDFFTKIKKTDIVGLGFPTIFANRAFKLAEKIKEKFNVPIIMGGSHASVLPELTLRNPNVDFVALGEGELSLLDIMNEKEPKNIKAIGYKENGEIKVNKGFNMIQDLDTVPFPARDLLNMDFYLSKKNSFSGMNITDTPIFTSRGCCYKCRFCSHNAVRGRGMRFHSVDYVTRELKHVIDIYHPQGIFFGDDLFTANKDRLFDICDRMIESGVNERIVWECNSRVDTIDEDMLRRLKEAGCVQIMFGFESGCQKILSYLKSNTTTVEQNKAAIDMCKKIGIRVLGFFMLGNPYETKEELEETINFILSNPIDFTSFSITTPYPGSVMWDDYLKMNNITDLSKLKWDDFVFGKGNFFVPKEREEEFKKICKELSIKISIRNYPRKILIKRALKNPANTIKAILSYVKTKAI